MPGDFGSEFRTDWIFSFITLCTCGLFISSQEASSAHSISPKRAVLRSLRRTRERKQMGPDCERLSLIPGHEHGPTEGMEEEVEAEKGGRGVFADAKRLDVNGMDNGKIAMFPMPLRR